MPETYFIHFNGGPMDDQEKAMEVGPPYLVYVARPLTRLVDVSSFPQEETERITFQQGFYELRRFSDGSFVWHDLKGTIDADWKGWLPPL